MDNRKEVIRMIQHYWEEWGDMEKIYDIICINNQRENFSRLIFTIDQAKIWGDKVDKIVAEL